MLKCQQWIKNLSLAIGLLILLIGILQVEEKYNQQICRDIQVKIIPIAAQHFIDEQAILTYLNGNATLPFYNIPLHQVKTKELENVIKSHSFVQLCTVYKNWQGSLKINASPRHILARIINTPGPDLYIDITGMTVPLSPVYTPNVLLLESKKFYKLNSNILTSSEGQGLLNMLKLISEDPFWKAQITHINITQQNEFILSTKFSRHEIYLGNTYKLEKKMKKLKLFYKVILPYKGWNTYKRINLKFDNQIVCE